MWKPILALLAASAATIPGQALAAEGEFTSTPSCVSVKVAYAEKQWRDPTPLNGRDLCTPKTHKGLRRTIDHFKLWRRFRIAAPYPGLHEGDKWLTHLAVPAYIVRCETNGYYGQGRWSAANGSGAVGPYQLLGWGAVYPARTPEAKVQNHEIASRLSLSNWACA